MMTRGFVFLQSYFQALRPLPDSERLALLDAILDFAFEGKEPDGLPPLLNGYFSILRPNIESGIRRYNAAVTNGKGGGRPPKKPTETQQKPNENSTEIRTKPRENLDKDMDMDIVNTMLEDAIASFKLTVCWTPGMEWLEKAMGEHRTALELEAVNDEITDIWRKLPVAQRKPIEDRRQRTKNADDETALTENRALLEEVKALYLKGGEQHG